MSPNRTAACPICWQQHAWADHHRVVGRVRAGDVDAAISLLIRLGIRPPRRYDLRLTDDRAYALLAMEEDARERGLELALVDGAYVVARTLTVSHRAA